MLWSREAVASTVGGRPVGPTGAPWTGVGIDSRAAVVGSLFVPVRAARDGHAWIADALAAGAGGYLADEAFARSEPLPAGAPGVVVADTGRALLDLGRAARARLAAPVVGVTGSVGKTSTKDLLAAALATSRSVTASERSFNTELGVPLTLANADPATAVAVIEMGARGPGHIALLCDVARPDVGIVTAVAAVHTELFGTIDDVAAGKGELIEALPPSGTAVLNADDERVAGMRGRSSARVLTYAASGVGADVAAERVAISERLVPSFHLATPWGSADVTLSVLGVHQVANSLAAAAAALALGAPLDAVVEGLAGAAISPWRMELARTGAGGTVLNDAYNASPTSMGAALRSVAALPARRRTAVLGRMAELGPTSASEHRAVADLAASLGVVVIGVDTDAYGTAPVTLEEAAGMVGPVVEGEVVLVKGSRVVGLERLAALLVG